MTCTHEVVSADGRYRFTEIIEDDTLVAALAAKGKFPGNVYESIRDDHLIAALSTGDPVTFRVIDDEWNEDYTVRTIRRAEIIEPA